MANKLWDDVRKSLQEFGTLAAEKGREFSKAAADKAEELTRVGKIRLDLVQVNREIERLFSELGGKVYHLHSEDALKSLGKDEEIKTLFEKISALEEKKKALDDQLEKVGKSEDEAGADTEDSEPAEKGKKTESDTDTEENPEEEQAK